MKKLINSINKKSDYYLLQTQFSTPFITTLPAKVIALTVVVVMVVVAEVKVSIAV